MPTSHPGSVITVLLALCGTSSLGLATPVCAAQSPAPTQVAPQVILSNQPLSAAAYAPRVRDALLAFDGDPRSLEGVPLTTVHSAGVTSGSLQLMTIPISQTGLVESYLIFEPLTPTLPAPLLVHFHAGNVSAYDLVFFTEFLAEADARNWYVVAPFQLVAQPPTTNSYSSIPSQYHVEAVIEWALGTYTIDRDRIYGYGFSMGGGNALNYAARHLDRARGTFAALVNHTGTLSLPDEYANALSPNAVRPVLEGHFGGIPSARRFEYLRSSVLELDATSQVAWGGYHAIVNLAHAPMQSWFATLDPQAHLVAQARRLDELLALVPGAQHTLVPVVSSAHRWDTLDETIICDWFAAHSLTFPIGGELLVDKSGRYLAFDLTVAATDRFTHLFHDARPTRFSLTETSNLVELVVHAPDVGLVPLSVPFEVLVDTADGAPDRVVITGFDRAPGTVERDGVATATWWSYDGPTQTLVIEDPDGETHLWSIR